MLDANGNTLAGKPHNFFFAWAEQVFMFLLDTAEAFSPEADEKKDSSTPNGASAPGGPVKANKGMILKKSVEYIRYYYVKTLYETRRNSFILLFLVGTFNNSLTLKRPGTGSWRHNLPPRKPVRTEMEAQLPIVARHPHH